MSWIVEVDWIDASCDASETREYEMTGVVRARTYGVLIRADDKQVSVAGEVLDAENAPLTYRSVTHIPRGMQPRIRKLRKFE